MTNAPRASRARLAVPITNGKKRPIGPVLPTK